jgi:uracil-DNA glycosylase family protein
VTATAAPVPDRPTLPRLQAAAATCEACELHRNATQTVFGDGAPDARVLFLGEQPGDEEDREGEPFVGPAGRELDRGLEAVGIGRGDVYITNVVKHFFWTRTRGRKRLHETPKREHLAACRPWLDAELDVIQPTVVVALGATAGKALFGGGFRVTRDRGELRPGPHGAVATATVHPSSILRSRSDEERYAARDAFHDDLRVAAALIHDGPEAALALQTRERLYARAQELDVPGRSQMDKAALAAAVAGRLRADLHTAQG